MARSTWAESTRSTRSRVTQAAANAAAEMRAPKPCMARIGSSAPAIAAMGRPLAIAAPRRVTSGKTPVRAWTPPRWTRKALRRSSKIRTAP